LSQLNSYSLLKYKVYLSGSIDITLGNLVPVDVMIYSNNSVALDVVTIILICFMGLTFLAFVTVTAFFLCQQQRRIPFVSLKKSRSSIEELVEANRI